MIYVIIVALKIVLDIASGTRSSITIISSSIITPTMYMRCGGGIARTWQHRMLVRPRLLQLLLLVATTTHHMDTDIAITIASAIAATTTTIIVISTSVTLTINAS